MAKEKNGNVQEQTTQRDGFSSKFGFILACVGSAVGMANIWLFPYRLGQFGGAAFLIPYIIFVLLLGFSGVIGEMALGRAMGTGPLGAFEKAFERRGNRKLGMVIGFIPVIGSLGIAIGYAVVVGWILRFLAGSLTGSMMAAENTGAYFGQIAGNFGSLGWHLAALILAFIIMYAGVANGIEKVNKVMMPAFFILFLILAVRIFMLPGAMDGYKFLFTPKWEFLADPKTWVYALGQAFFSLSLAGSGTVVYGSYLSKKEDILDSARSVAIFDTIASMLAAFVIIPAVFAYKLDPGSGPPLIFITLPSIFQEMPAGGLFAIVFFIAVLFAGITSLINLFETPVEALQERFKLSRLKSITIVGVIAFAVGVFLEGDLLSPWMDIVSIYIIPLGALLAAITIYWVCGKGFARAEVEIGKVKPLGKWFEPVTMYLFCGVAVAVYILGIFYGGIG